MKRRTSTALTGFCGWLGHETSADDAASTLQRMAKVLARSRDAEAAVLVGSRAAAAGLTGATPVRADRYLGYLAVIFGRPRLAPPLSRDGSEAPASPADLIEGFRDRGESLLDHLRGGFALAIVSEDGRDGLLAIDRVGGRHPLAYTVRGESIVFATDVAAIQAHPMARSEIDPQSLYNYLYLNVVPSPRSIRRDVRILTPGTYLRIRNGLPQTGRYWAPRYEDDGQVSLSRLTEEFRDLIQRCVEVPGEDGAVGCFLSGGTDSSTVAGALSQLPPGPARSYSIGFGTEGYDEMQYARGAARHFGTEHHEYQVTPEDLVDWIPKVAEAYAEPFGNASALPTFFCAKLAKDDGIDRMLAGDGGDELFAGNERYAKQKVFEAYWAVPTALRRWFLEPMVLGLPGIDRIPVLRKARSYVEQARIPMPQRMETYNFIERFGRERIVDPSLISTIDPDEPSRLLEETYRSADAKSLVNKMLALDLKFTIADNDLPKVSRMCQLAGIEVAYPFLEDAMLEFSLRVPARLKLKGLKLRWFQKQAMKGFLPDETLNKKKQGFGLPFGIWMAEHAGLRDFTLESLQGLKSRGVVQEKFIDELLLRHQNEHASYFGVMIWVLMMLEQWYRAHCDAKG